MRRRIVAGALAAGLLLAGCVGTPPGYKKVAGSPWIGQDQRALVAKLGKPTRSFTTADGILVLIYDHTDWVSEGGGGVPGEAIPLDCSTAFSLRDGRIFGIKSKGNGCS
jgi:hypothetical protein